MQASLFELAAVQAATLPSVLLAEAPPAITPKPAAMVEEPVQTQRYEGWANSATFAAEMQLRNDSHCHREIMKMAARQDLTGATLQSFVLTLGKTHFGDDGQRLPGCPFYLPEWAAGKVAWDEIAQDWVRTAVDGNYNLPLEDATPAQAVSRDELAVLAAATIDDAGVLYLPGQLERKLYEAANRIIEALGGTWSRKAKGHVFDQHPGERIDAVLQSGIIPKSGKVENYGFFVTQPELADATIARCGLRPGMTSLEPSGGEGALASRAAHIVGIENVTVVELQEKNVATLREQGFAPIQGDFLAYRPERGFDVVVMNPPFSRQADIDHVQHAWAMVNPGGRLVAIMAASVGFRSNAKTTAFRELIAAYGELFENPEGSFKASGTNVNTVTVVLNKPQQQ